jgi:hypothetical protein
MTLPTDDFARVRRGLADLDSGPSPGDLAALGRIEVRVGELYEQLESARLALRRISDLYPRTEPAFRLAYEALNPTTDSQDGAEARSGSVHDPVGGESRRRPPSHSQSELDLEDAYRSELPKIEAAIAKHFPGRKHWRKELRDPWEERLETIFVVIEGDVGDDSDWDTMLDVHMDLGPIVTSVVLGPIDEYEEIDRN